MTTNQISYAKVAEDKRHNLATEEENVRHNRRSEQLSKQQNAINREHYERSDFASLTSAQASATSANAAAMNAVTNRKNYQLQADIEYSSSDLLGTDFAGIPLSSIVKASQAELVHQQTETEAEKTKHEAAATEKTIEEGKIAHEQAKFAEGREQATILNNLGSAGSTILNSVFGRGGIVKTVNDLLYGTQSSNK